VEDYFLEVRHREIFPCLLTLSCISASMKREKIGHLKRDTTALVDKCDRLQHPKNADMARTPSCLTENSKNVGVVFVSGFDNDRERSGISNASTGESRTDASAPGSRAGMIVMALRTDGNHRYSWTRNKRSSFVSWTRPRTFRRNTNS
jgi:hypothetical protein